MTPRGNPQNWVTDADYPSAALRAGDQGVVGFRLEVDATGKVSSCSVTASSGSSLLDTTACNLLKRRARFSPAEDSSGNKIPDSYSNRIRWTIPKD
jgi:protein TonB